MITLREVSKYYGRGKQPIQAVHKASLSVAQAEFVMLTGHSGSGKTTLLNLMAGMTRPDAGGVMIAGEDLLAMSDARRTRLRAQTFGFVFQFQSMISTLNVLDNLCLPALFSRRPLERQASLAMLAHVGLAGRERAYAHELSLGEQRRVSIARALIARPPVLLCDEPTGDLDPENEQVVMGLIRQAHQGGATVVMVTHNHALCAQADTLYRMNRGRLELPGSPQPPAHPCAECPPAT